MLRAAIGVGVALFAAVANAQNLGVADLRLETAAPTVSGGETVRLTLSVKRDPNVAPQPLSFTLESSQDALTRFAVRTVELPASQGRTFIDMGTAATPIKTPLTISATLKSPGGMRTTAPLELVPALIKQATLNSTTLTGTFGASITGTVELKAPAPTGGIQVYSALKGFTPGLGAKGDLAMLVSTVPAGTRVATFVIRYNDILQAFSSADMSSVNDFRADFESITRTAEQFVALDPTTNWVPIPDRAVRLTYTLNPLRITATTAQPNTLSNGAEAVGTFTLNAAPGPGERVKVYVNSSAIRVVPLGGSCQSASNFDLLLATGTTSNSFKICARQVSSPTTVNVVIAMRSGEYRLPVTVQP